MTTTPFRWIESLLLRIAVLLPLLSPALAPAQMDYEREPICYDTAPVHDPIAQLQQQLDAGDIRLEYDQRHGYLPSVLKHLNVPVSSQVLVFSKTSLQASRISPQRPRALYFNDETYVGWVQRGDVVELMATDPEQGEIFYTLSQVQTERPAVVRDRGQCLACHATSRTQGVPGALVRSVFVEPSGQPLLSAGTFTSDHTSPFNERLGGWYVTGTHGSMRHMGNVLATERTSSPELDREAGANQTDLASRVDVSPYLTPHSDLIALMILEHQSQMHNLLTRASYETRSARHYDGIMNEVLKRPADYVSESTKRRIASVGDKLLKYLLFVDEFPLESPVKGTSKFAEEFSSKGPRDGQGRSLRDLDLQMRLLKYPCSHLIYSPSFDGLPELVKSYVSQRLHKVLTGEDKGPEFEHLSAGDRQAILAILQDTKPDLWGG